MKKLLSLVLALCMVLMLGAAFAADGDRTSDATISVTGLTVGDVVTPYQVVEWVPGSGWAFTSAFSSLTAEDLKAIVGSPAIADDPTTTDVNEATAAVPGAITQALADKIAALATGGTAEDPLTTNTWEKNVASNPGLYMVVITAKESGVIYNPAFVAADFNSGNTTNTIAISASYSDTAVAKKSTITTLKTVAEAEDKINAAKASMVGDIVSFTVTTQIPVFLDSYKNPYFKLTDTVSAGMELVVDDSHPITIKYGTQTTTATDDNVTITKVDNSTWNAVFAKAYLQANATAADVTATYYARITNAASFNVNRDKNTVTVEYSNGPNDEKGIQKDITNHYTFSIGASVIGKQNKKGYEAVKVGVDRDGNELTSLTEVTLDNGDDTDTAHSLAGALFGLYTTEAAATAGKGANEADNGLVVNKNYPNGATFTTVADGIITFTGLDAGTYYLKELSAPDGYIKDNNVHTVIITAEYEKKSYTETISGMSVTYETSVLKDYTVTIDGHATTYNFNNEGLTDIDPVIKDITTDEDRIKNIQGVELPSTGGIGTTIFYVLGGLLVVGAAVILVARRKAHE